MDIKFSVFIMTLATIATIGIAEFHKGDPVIIADSAMASDVGEVQTTTPSSIEGIAAVEYANMVKQTEGYELKENHSLMVAMMEYQKSAAAKKEAKSARREQKKAAKIQELKAEIAALEDNNKTLRAEIEEIKDSINESDGIKYFDIPIPEYKGMKTYERYTKLGETTNQGRLQAMAVTDEYGFRRVCGRYTIAVGSATGARVGQYLDVVLQNGTVIPCIMGDQKADADTEDNNLITAHSQCCSEFIVDDEKLPESMEDRGDVSYVFKEWQSPVSYIRVYGIAVPGF